MSHIPLGVLDLVPVASGSTAAEALHRSIDLARAAERAGYARYWFAEHHLNPGVAGTSPAVVLALTASATSTIRLGSGAVLLGHRTALATVEEFGLLDALHPGRIDLGLGRSPGPPPASAGTAGRGSGHAAGQEPATAPRRDAAGGAGGAGGAEPVRVGRAARRTPDGLVLPPPSSFAHLLGSPRVALQQRLLRLPGARTQDYAEQVDDLLALLRGDYLSPEGVAAHPVPGTGADVQVWVLGSSGGVSAEVAGRNGLRFGANYHVAPAGVLEAADAYRAAFKPSADLDRPYLTVSADVVVAEDDTTARELAAGYGPWVRSIRTAEGAIPYPSPAEAAAYPWTAEDHALVADRLDTRFVGSPDRVAAGLALLQEATGADELLVTTITHDHTARVRSYELLAEAWRSV
ncbi:LLM class flavin-dependent oxidoreductase [Streptomyces sp. NRRL S-87]|uniref:LLM class flavin-dependent oxidoreductase n=1 Tax=Streptomyces sp. NRRL S-87 TaxID=1463920 RepID=UPI0004C26CB5|nr:LLM class flavin-dependent oxidoreductase [Streptomyces sp. NRRL S-87]